MRRTPELQQLSRDHHQSLSRALLLRRATPEDAANVRSDVLAFWRRHGARHFRIEEEILLPACAHRVDPARSEVARVLTDHVWIRAQMDRLGTGDVDLDGMHELGQRLDAHVRHEERILFPLIEESLEPDELVSLACAIANAERD